MHKSLEFVFASTNILSHLVAEAAVVHRGQAVVDGGGSVLVERLPGRLGLQVTVLQGLHHRLCHLALNLGNKQSLNICFWGVDTNSNNVKCKSTCSWAFLESGA